MQTSRVWPLAILLVLVQFSTAAGAEVPGEFSIPQVSPLNDVQLEALRDLVDADPEARRLAVELKQTAQPLLDAEPHPLEVIHYEGLVNTNPSRIATVARLREMADVAKLMRYWQASGDPEAAATLKKFIDAWSSVYRITGNDVNENKFYPLLVAYEALRSDFTPAQRETVDAWVEQLGAAHYEAVEKATRFTNRYSKHVRLAAICGRILDRREWVAAAERGIRTFVSESLYEDGSSYDLKHRDTLTYHISALRPPIELAMLSGDGGAELYRWSPPSGGSLEKSVNFVVPYALGDKTRREWLNSRVDLDRRRAEAGLEKYRRGRRFDPQDALKLMEQASFFDPALTSVVRHLTDSAGKRFSSWQMVINHAAKANSP